MSIKRLVTKTKYIQAKELYKEASICYRRSYFILLNPLDHHGVIESMQHCFELSLKSLWLVVGLTYPNIHDAGKKIEKITNRYRKILPNVDFELWAKIEEWVRTKSEYIADLHHKTIYGDEDRNIPASKLFSEEEMLNIIHNVSVFHTFIKGPIQLIGNALNLLTDEERLDLERKVQQTKLMLSNPQKFKEIRKKVDEFFAL